MWYIYIYIFKFLIIKVTSKNLSDFVSINITIPRRRNESDAEMLDSQRTMLGFTTLYSALFVHKDFNGILASN